MRIKDKGQLALGIFNILMSVVGVMILVVQHRTERILILGICFACGITGILNGIETKAQRQKRKEELQAMAKMYGWGKRGDSE
jgi:hypothetical protein